MKGEGRREKHTEEPKRSFNWELALRVPKEFGLHPKDLGVECVKCILARLPGGALRKFCSEERAGKKSPSWATWQMGEAFRGRMESVG